MSRKWCLKSHYCQINKEYKYISVWHLPQKKVFFFKYEYLRSQLCVFGIVWMSQKLCLNGKIWDPFFYTKIVINRWPIFWKIEKLSHSKMSFMKSLIQIRHLPKLILSTLKPQNKSTMFWYQNQAFYIFKILQGKKPRLFIRKCQNILTRLLF